MDAFGEIAHEEGAPRREGTAERLSSRFARVRVRPAHRDCWLAESRPEEWLLIEWPEGEAAPTKYWFSTLPANIGFRQLVDITKLRWRIERDYHELKQEVGLGHFEGRGWRGFHHHATLCIAAYGFLVSERETISPSATAATKIFKQATIPENYRSRGSAISEEYHYYGYIASDVPLSSIRWNDNESVFESDIDQELQKLLAKRADDNGSKRPDIALFSKEGSAIIVEFKAPGVSMDGHVGDLSEYAHLLAAKSGGRLRRFYGYLIGDTVNSLRLSGTWTPFSVGLGWLQSSAVLDPRTPQRWVRPILNCSTSVTSLSERRSGLVYTRTNSSWRNDLPGSAVILFTSA
ncbi:hypothetical protein ABIB82_007528 [Bradyrhizobium sp. i1.8.4]